MNEPETLGVGIEAAVEAAKQFFRDNPDADAFTCVLAPPPVAA